MTKNNTKQLRGGLEVDRPDTCKDRQHPSTFIATTRRPILGNDREAYAKDAYTNGVPLENIITSTGWNVSQLFTVLGIDRVERKAEYDRLCEFRRDLYSKKR